MKERQEIAIRNPIQRGPEIFNRSYHRDLEVDGLMLSTTLAVMCFATRPPTIPTWTASAVVLSRMMAPLSTASITPKQKRVVWGVLEELLGGVGDGVEERVEAATTFLLSRQLSPRERRALERDEPAEAKQFVAQSKVYS